MDPGPVGPIVSLFPAKEPSVTLPSVLGTRANMESLGGISGMYSGVVPSSRLQEKEELQRLNERFSAYVTRVRHLGQHANNVDTSVFLRSTKILEEEITNLKNMYENELEKLRKEIEEGAHGRNVLHVQNNKQQKYIGDLQDRLTVETDKNSRLLDDINILQRRIGNLEAEVKDAHIAAQRPQEEVNLLQRSVDNLMREVDQWKRRYEQQQVSSQENEDRLQQVMKKFEFSDQVHNQQILDYQNRLDTAAVNILSLEARVQELSAADVSVNEMLKVREAAEMELRKYQIESEEQYSRNLSALKAQIDYDAETIQKLSQEKSELAGSIGELQAKIRNLEGQVANLQHQKRSLEDAVAVERNRGAENIRQLEKKLKDVQDMLVTKMYEVTSVRESNIPLKTEIEALKALLEEEERRMCVPLGTVSTSALQVSKSQPPSASEFLKTSSLSAHKAATSSYLQPTAVSSYVQSRADIKNRSALDTVYSREGNTLAYDIDYNLERADYNPEHADYNPEHADYNTESADYDLLRHEVSLPMTGSQYFYESSPSLSRLHVDPSPPLTSRVLGPIQSRANPTPVNDQEVPDTDKTKTKQKTWNYIPAKFGCGRDYFEEMFQDTQKNTPVSKLRPKSSPLVRHMPSSFHDYTVSTSSAIGDLNILEVEQEGKYVRLVNDGPREIEIGGYIIRQNVDGHPMAIFKFPSDTKFPPSTTITVWSAMNGSQVHNPPTDFFWEEQQKWGTGPEYSTILCQSNGQAVAWTTAAHRYSKDAVGETATSKPGHEVSNQNDDENIRDDDSLAEQNMDSGSMLEPAILKREKQLPPLLVKFQHPLGGSPAAVVYPQVKQKQQPTLGNESSKQNYQTKQHVVPAQNATNKAMRISGNSQQPRPPTIRGNGTLANKQSGSIHIDPRSPYLSTLQEKLINETRDRIHLMS